MSSVYIHIEKRRVGLPTAMILSVFSEKRRIVLPTTMMSSVYTTHTVRKGG